ncbi:FAD-binding oxidoreductase [Streptomyces iconiensis]|uniref:FAD-binding protein n=1 Tax=Streptomyces iconiensis TaxID=1384038 RepID=A0ABT7A577_9ACTN|nr:FAD-dependent oxidoreductase [Streptomyces iconiensis]MDJ1135763.1 FAD-binding protein [Streptomyces iconiensis]
MTASTAGPTTALTAALRRTFPDERIRTTGPGYESARALWNGAVTARPSVIACCSSPADVQAGVRAAREAGVPLSVRGGGHGWSGNALAEGGLTLDLTGMRQVEVDPRTRTARVAGGASAADVAGAAQAYGLVAVTGTAGAVGMAGLALGGGYGPLSGRFGLAVDSVLSVDIVLADGSLVTADAGHESDLFWAVRGAGGNFGAVTGMRLRLHQIPALLSGMVIYPAAQADPVLAALADHLPAGGPDELTVQTGFTAGPDGTPVLFAAPTWCGEAEAGERAIAPLTRLGDPLATQTGPVTLAGMLAGIDAAFPSGRHVEITTRTLTGLTPAVRGALTAGGNTLTSPLSALSLHSLHGAATRVPAADTAFGNRTPHLMTEIIATWEPDDPTPATHRTWAHETSRALAPHALPGGYANLLPPDATDQITHAYGANGARLLGVKRRYDPDAVFRAIPLPEPPHPGP